MDRDSLLKDFQGRLRSIEESFVSELGSLQTGRAHPALLDGIMVEAYESRLPLAQVASIMVEAATIRVTPFETATLEAIRNAVAGFERVDFNPTDDGRCIYIQVPPLTTERRQQVVKSLRRPKRGLPYSPASGPPSDPLGSSKRSTWPRRLCGPVRSGLMP